MLLTSSPATSLTGAIRATPSPSPGGMATTTHLPAWPCHLLAPPYQAQTGTCSFLSQRDLSSGFSSQCSHPRNGGSSQTAPGGCHPGTCCRKASQWVGTGPQGDGVQSHRLLGSHQDKDCWSLCEFPSGPGAGVREGVVRSTLCAPFPPLPVEAETPCLASLDLPGGRDRTLF